MPRPYAPGLSMRSELNISLAHRSAAEERTRAALRALLATYDVEGWIYTPVVIVDERAQPHSHPILTMNVRHERHEHLLLSEFVHEQLHWFEEANSAARDRAIEETRRYYPHVPASPPEGAFDEYSTRLHLLVCHLEHQAMKRLVGHAVARDIMLTLSLHHYCWVYRTIVADEPVLAEIVSAHDLLPDPLRERTACGS